jgi:hypothetical protein
MLKKKKMMRKMMKLKEEDDDEEVEYDADDPRKIHNNSNKMTEMFIKRVEVLLHDE